MSVASNPFLAALADGRPQIGIWASLCSNFAAETIAPAGFDWVLLDMEHAPNSIDGVLGQLQAFSATRATPLVRPPWNDAVIVKRLLDLGPSGLLFPMIQSVEEAEAAVTATRYPPRGIRGVSGSTRANAFGRKADYFERIEDETAVLVQIETRQALASAGEIAAVDGVDGVFFGPADIAADLGYLGKPMCDEVWDAILPVAQKLMAAGVPVGTLVMDADFAARLLREGFGFVACGQDTTMLARAADQLLARVRENL